MMIAVATCSRGRSGARFRRSRCTTTSRRGIRILLDARADTPRPGPRLCAPPRQRKTVIVIPSRGVLGYDGTVRRATQR
jgi:hypothetical protein